MTNPETDQSARISVKARIAGCEVTVEVGAPADTFKEALNQVLSQLTEIGVEPLGQPPAGGTPEGPLGQSEAENGAESPLAGLAREIDVQPADLRRVFGVKGDNVQLYRAGQYSLADAVCILGLAYEKGLGHAGMPFDTFSSLVAANHIKTKTPLRTLCFNLIRDGRVEKKSYEDGGLVVLTPAGEQAAGRAIKAVLAGEQPARRASRKSARGRKP